MLYAECAGYVFCYVEDFVKGVGGGEGRGVVEEAEAGRFCCARATALVVFDGFLVQFLIHLSCECFIGRDFGVVGIMAGTFDFDSAISRFCSRLMTFSHFLEHEYW